MSISGYNLEGSAGHFLSPDLWFLHDKGNVLSFSTFVKDVQSYTLSNDLILLLSVFVCLFIINWS